MYLFGSTIDSRMNCSSGTPAVCASCGSLSRSGPTFPVAPAAFSVWHPPQPLLSKTVFVTNGCGGCHTLKAAGATGKVGPDLDKLASYAQQAGKPLEQFIRESIVNPEAYIQPGYPAHVMPGTFGSLPKTQLDALVKFISTSAQGSK